MAKLSIPVIAEDTRICFFKSEIFLVKAATLPAFASKAVPPETPAATIVTGSNKAPTTEPNVDSPYSIWETRALLCMSSCFMWRSSCKASALDACVKTYSCAANAPVILLPCVSVSGSSLLTISTSS